MNSYTDSQQHFRSNRKYLRITTELSCQVGQPGGRLDTAQVLDLSIGGLKFRCTQAIVNNIIPEGERTVGLIMDVMVDVQFKLTSEAKRANVIKTAARIVHSERLAQDVFHVGVQFTALGMKETQQLEAYIQDQDQGQDPDQ